MRILILGGDGYLGWPTAMHFSDLGHEVNEEPNRNADLAIFVISRSGEGKAPPA